MAEHRSKNTLGRSVPVNILTDVEDDGTSEDGSPRPVCIILVRYEHMHHIIMHIYPQTLTFLVKI